MIECLVHGESCLHCGVACRMEHDIWKNQLAAQSKLLAEAEARIVELEGAIYNFCLPCPICHGKESCDHPIYERGQAFLKTPRPRSQALEEHVAGKIREFGEKVKFKCNKCDLKCSSILCPSCGSNVKVKDALLGCACPGCRRNQGRNRMVSCEECIGADCYERNCGCPCHEMGH